MNHDEKQIVENAMRVTRSATKLNDNVEEAKRLFVEATRLAEVARQYQEDINRIISEKTVCFPWLADALARYHEAADLKIAQFLLTKVRPAADAAEKVRELARQRREDLRAFHLARFRVKYYESLFPWLDEYVDDDLDELVRQDRSREASSGDESDPVEAILGRIPPAEYNLLTSTERNQRALDIWRAHGSKSNWELGRDYERYQGYLYEQQGYEVKYNGATEKLEDMGRDLIAEKDGTTWVVQCKYWADFKEIHEKHVFQLYGSAVQMKLERTGWQIFDQPLLFSDAGAKSGIVPILVTSTVLSDRAKAVAKALGVQYREKQPLDRNYPVIKCNISTVDREKIYHLPFDQQYDRTFVHKKRGEFYAKTVAEAEADGFRRAWRFRGSF